MARLKIFHRNPLKDNFIKRKFLVILLANLAFYANATDHSYDEHINKTTPTEFVWLKEVAPDIVQEIRYAGAHNFVGRPISGYQAATCMLTRQAATALAKVQAALRLSRLSLKVYDCYRPQRSVNDFIAWSQQPEQQEMKIEFYPRIDKKDFFKLGYVAKQSGHTRGSTVDLTIVALPVQSQANYTPGERLISCTAPANQRFQDNSLDFGTGYDCLDTRSHHENLQLGIVAQSNRLMLRTLMKKYGFQSYEKEWWHYTLRHEPFEQTYFDFPVTYPLQRDTGDKAVYVDKL